MIIAGGKSPMKGGRNMFKGLPFTRVSSAHLLGDMWYLFDANAVTNTQEQQSIGTNVNEWFSCAPGTLTTRLTSTSTPRPIQRGDHIELSDSTQMASAGANFNGGVGAPVILHNFTSYAVFNIFTTGRYIAVNNNGPGNQFGGNVGVFGNGINFLLRNRPTTDRDVYFGLGTQVNINNYLRTINDRQENIGTKFICVFTSSGIPSTVDAAAVGLPTRTLFTNRFAGTEVTSWVSTATTTGLTGIDLYPTRPTGGVLRMYEFGFFRNALSVRSQDILFNYLCNRWL